MSGWEFSYWCHTRRWRRPPGAFVVCYFLCGNSTLRAPTTGFVRPLGSCLDLEDVARRLNRRLSPATAPLFHHLVSLDPGDRRLTSQVVRIRKFTRLDWPDPPQRPQRQGKEYAGIGYAAAHPPTTSHLPQGRTGAPCHTSGSSCAAHHTHPLSVAWSSRPENAPVQVTASSQCMLGLVVLISFERSGP